VHDGDSGHTQARFWLEWGCFDLLNSVISVIPTGTDHREVLYEILGIRYGSGRFPCLPRKVFNCKHKSNIRSRNFAGGGVFGVVSAVESSGKTKRLCSGLDTVNILGSPP
jgi:hypothetical protein